MTQPSMKVARQPHMAIEDPAALREILRRAPFGHVGIVDGGLPVVIPMAYVSDDQHLYLHGSTRSRLMMAVGSGAPVFLTVTLFDGLVLAKSAYNHAMNYRSVSVYGTGTAITERAGKLAALKALSDKYVPGRWETVRAPTEGELESVLVARVPLDRMSGKARSGPPDDFPQDLSHPVWSGVLPFTLAPGGAEPDQHSPAVPPVNVQEAQARGAL
jgi:uncharacterized protein